MFSAQAGYKINNNFELSLSINNLFDKHYFASMGGGDSSLATGDRWYYGEPRSFTVALRGNF